MRASASTVRFHSVHNSAIDQPTSADPTNPNARHVYFRHNNRHHPLGFTLRIDNLTVLLDAGCPVGFTDPSTWLTAYAKIIDTVDAVLISSPAIIACGAIPFLLKMRPNLVVEAMGATRKGALMNCVASFQSVFGSEASFSFVDPRLMPAGLSSSSSSSSASEREGRLRAATAAATRTIRMSTREIYEVFSTHVKEPFGFSAVLRPAVRTVVTGAGAHKAAITGGTGNGSSSAAAAGGGSQFAVAGQQEAEVAFGGVLHTQSASHFKRSAEDADDADPQAQHAAIAAGPSLTAAAAASTTAANDDNNDPAAASGGAGGDAASSSFQIEARAFPDGCTLGGYCWVLSCLCDEICYMPHYSTHHSILLRPCGLLQAAAAANNHSSRRLNNNNGDGDDEDDDPKAATGTNSSSKGNNNNNNSSAAELLRHYRSTRVYAGGTNENAQRCTILITDASAASILPPTTSTAATSDLQYHDHHEQQHQQKQQQQEDPAAFLCANVHTALRRDHDAIIPVDATGRGLEVLTILDAFAEAKALSYRILFVYRHATELLEAVKTRTEALHDTIIASEVSLFRNITCVKDMAEAANIPRPRVLVCDGADMDFGPAMEAVAEAALLRLPFTVCFPQQPAPWTNAGKLHAYFRSASSGASGYGSPTSAAAAAAVQHYLPTEALALPSSSSSSSSRVKSSAASPQHSITVSYTKMLALEGDAADQYSRELAAKAAAEEEKEAEGEMEGTTKGKRAAAITTKHDDDEDEDDDTTFDATTAGTGAARRRGGGQTKGKRKASVAVAGLNESDGDDYDSNDDGHNVDAQEDGPLHSNTTQTAAAASTNYNANTASATAAAASTTTTAAANPPQQQQQQHRTPKIFRLAGPTGAAHHRDDSNAGGAADEDGAGTAASNNKTAAAATTMMFPASSRRSLFTAAELTPYGVALDASTMARIKRHAVARVYNDLSGPAVGQYTLQLRNTLLAAATQVCKPEHVQGAVVPLDGCWVVVADLSGIDVSKQLARLVARGFPAARRVVFIRGSASDTQQQIVGPLQAAQRHRAAMIASSSTSVSNKNASSSTSSSSALYHLRSGRGGFADDDMLSDLEEQPQMGEATTTTSTTTSKQQQQQQQQVQYYLQPTHTGGARAFVELATHVAAFEVRVATALAASAHRQLTRVGGGGGGSATSDQSLLLQQPNAAATNGPTAQQQDTGSAHHTKWSIGWITARVRQTSTAAIAANGATNGGDGSSRDCVDSAAAVGSKRLRDDDLDGGVDDQNGNQPHETGDADGGETATTTAAAQQRSSKRRIEIVDDEVGGDDATTTHHPTTNAAATATSNTTASNSNSSNSNSAHPQTMRVLEPVPPSMAAAALAAVERRYFCRGAPPNTTAVNTTATASTSGSGNTNTGITNPTATSAPPSTCVVAVPRGSVFIGALQLPVLAASIARGEANQHLFNTGTAAGTSSIAAAAAAAAAAAVVGAAAAAGEQQQKEAAAVTTSASASDTTSASLFADPFSSDAYITTTTTTTTNSSTAATSSSARRHTTDARARAEADAARALMGDGVLAPLGCFPTLLNGSSLFFVGPLTPPSAMHQQQQPSYISSVLPTPQYNGHHPSSSSSASVPVVSFGGIAGVAAGGGATAGGASAAHVPHVVGGHVETELLTSGTLMVGRSAFVRFHDEAAAMMTTAPSSSSGADISGGINGGSARGGGGGGELIDASLEGLATPNVFALRELVYSQFSRQL